jgi:transcriptional regulator with XRE-family HTH domain
MPSPSSYGTWLASARAAVGWSVEQVAQAAGVPLTVVVQIEDGRIGNPDSATRGKLEAALQAEAIARDRRAAGEAVPQTETMVREYRTLPAMQADVALLARQGWQITAQSESKHGRGCLFWLLKPQTRRTVTYTRTLTSG